LSVVGSAATATRRCVGTDLPIENRVGTRIDSNFLISPSIADQKDNRMIKAPLQATVSLVTNSNVIRKEGSSAPKHRVELSLGEEAENWIAELTVLGDLPWLPGESRTVSVRIMTSEFEDYVRKNRPDLLVIRGPNRIGHLSFE